MPTRESEKWSERYWSFVHPVQQVFELVESVAPEGPVVAHPVDEGSQRLGLGAVVSFASLVPVAYQPGTFQRSQML